MTTSAQLELEAEETRSQIASTLDELRDRMTPGQIVDQVIDYMRDSGGGMFVQNFRQQVVANPIPVTLVGAGIAWLAFASRRRTNGGIDPAGGAMRDRASAVAEGWSDSARETASDWAGQTGTAASRLGDRANEAGARLKGRADAATSALNDAASSAYDTAARGSRRLRENVASGGRTLTDLVKDQPLVVAGLGLALGALLGAVLPGTEAEDRLMGDASDAAKSDAKGFAEQQVEKGKAAAGEGLSAVGQALDQQQGESGRTGHTGSNAAGFASQDSEVPLVPSSESGPAETTSDGVSDEREHVR
jgi:ElaB/YqjD/DUF883 family membrane-anchored ribosome-binding protein